MPELPEVEVTRMGVAPHIEGQTVSRMVVRQSALRWPIDAQLPATNGTGNYAGVTIDEEGVVTASYDDGSNLVVGTVALANFVSPTGLRQVGSSNWKSTGVSGAATYGTPGTGANGSLLSGALERSNVDIAEELVGLITAQRYFQANAKAIDTATQIAQTVINLRT